MKSKFTLARDSLEYCIIVCIVLLCVPIRESRLSREMERAFRSFRVERSLLAGTVGLMTGRD